MNRETEKKIWKRTDRKERYEHREDRDEERREKIIWKEKIIMGSIGNNEKERKIKMIR